MSCIVAVFCVSVLAADALGSKSDNNERVRAMITFLDGGAWRFDEATEAFGVLTELAPSDLEAQNAVVRYLEHITPHRMAEPFCYARLLARFDAGFADMVMTSLSKTRSSGLRDLWLVTLALMGKKANKQVEPLTRYLHQQGDPESKTMARIVITIIGPASPDNLKIIEKEIHERTAAGRRAVWMGALTGFDTWASARLVSEVQDWLTNGISEDDRCSAAMALAISGCRDEGVTRNIEELLAEAMRAPDSSARICYAYALALLDPDHADRYWRVILTKLGPHQFNHTDNACILIMSVSIPAKQIAIVNQLRNDPDSEIAAEATKLGRLFEEFKSGGRKGGRKAERKG